MEFDFVEGGGRGRGGGGGDGKILRLFALFFFLYLETGHKWIEVISLKRLLNNLVLRMKRSNKSTRAHNECIAGRQHCFQRAHNCVSENGDLIRTSQKAHVSTGCQSGPS